MFFFLQERVGEQQAGPGLSEIRTVRAVSTLKLQRAGPSRAGQNIITGRVKKFRHADKSIQLA